MKKFLSLFAALLFACSTFAAYNLVKVTSTSGLKNGGLYVFERNGHVLDTVLKNDAVQTTDKYSKVALMGTENYVWSLEAVDEGNLSKGFGIKSVAKKSGHVYLNNSSSADPKTKITLANASSSAWQFEFTDEKALISNANNNDRFLGETASGSNAYKAYATTNLGSYGHDFTVYELQESSDPYIATKQATIDFGTVIKDEAVASQQVEVMFGNLTGAVLYSGISSPFTATGTIAASGDKITVSASSATIGDYSQTLLIDAEDDGIDVSVTVKMKVIAAPDPNATGFVLYEDDELVDGDYILCYDDGYDYYALKAVVTSDRLGYMTVEPENDIVESPDASIIWHLAKSGNYWTIYNAKEGKYAAATDAKNKAQLLADGADDKALWKVYIDQGYYDFENKARAASTSPDNKWLRFNASAEAFACYQESMGDWFTLFKSSASATAVDNTAVETKTVKLIENGRLVIIKNGIKYDAFGTLIQ